MNCIYCGSDTKVTNSRSRKLDKSVWRRRQCKSCVAQFTTNETADYLSSLVVRTSKNSLIPFSRDKLFISIFKALGHRNDALSCATDLTNTIISKTIRNSDLKDGCINHTALASVSYIVLKRFDNLASHTYKAYHIDSLKD